MAYGINRIRFVRGYLSMTDDINKQIEEFLARGGKVTELLPNQKGLEDGGFVSINECSGAPLHLGAQYLREKGLKGSKANKLNNELRRPMNAHRQPQKYNGNNKHANIKKTVSGKHQVVVSGVCVGTFEDENDALEARQKKREALGMHFIPLDK